ncbi:hypothetical protein [Micromonospora sp. NPDC004551]|uniref:hypothetical protein n=1 Tax=Micromonospora sp. NPDC004551 TaxID=3154284 RepID=UPI0033A623E9
MNERTTSRKTSWTCWAGDMSALNALGRVVQEVVDQRRREVAEKKRSELNALLNTFDEATVEIIRDWESGAEEQESMAMNAADGAENALQIMQKRARRFANKNHYEYQRLHSELTRFEEASKEDIVELTVVDKYEEVYGRVDEVLAEMDRRSTVSVRFRADGSRPPDRQYGRTSEYVSDGIHLRLGGQGDSPFRTDRPVSLTVTSPSAGWARAAFARVSDEIEKGVPRWAVVRRPSAQFSLSLLYFAVPYITVMLIIKARQPIWIAGFWAGIIAWLISSVSGTASRFHNWLFPPFEITQDGAESSGTRRILFLITLMLSVPIGILVNRIS